MKLDHERGHSLDELIQNLAETILWCSSRPKPWMPLTSFGSVAIAPDFGCSTPKSWVQSVAKQRRGALRRVSTSLNRTSSSQPGRLLAYFPDDSLACGMAAHQTQGFLTERNAPPWDTWVAYLQDEEHYLISRVPAAMTQLVESGIRVNPEQCFGWASARCPHLFESLATRGVKLE